MVKVSAPGPRVRPRVRVHPGVAAAVAADPGADYIRSTISLLLTM